MIIQCEQCRTKFRLDDSKVKDTGVKVRCARCKHIFAVSKEFSETTPSSDYSAISVQNTVTADQAQTYAAFATHAEKTQPEYYPGYPSVPVEAPVESTTTIDSNLFHMPDKTPLPAAEPAPGFSAEKTQPEYYPGYPSVPMKAPVESTTTIDSNLFHMPDKTPLPAAEPAPGFSAEKTQPEYYPGYPSVPMKAPVESTTTIDSTLFDLPEETPLPAAKSASDFSQIAHGKELEPERAAEISTSESTGKILEGFDFGDVSGHAENDTGEPSPFSEFVNSTASSTPLDFNVQLSDFADSAVNPEASAHEEAKAATSGGDHINLGEVDFGDNLAVLPGAQANPDTAKDGLDFDFSHLDKQHVTASTSAIDEAAVPLSHQEEQPPKILATDQPDTAKPLTAAAPIQPETTTTDVKPVIAPVLEQTAKTSGAEQPPLSIASRRKPAMLMPLLLAAAAVIGMGVMIYMGNNRHQEQAEKPVAAAGNITLGTVDAVFLNNKNAGELLVIAGTAVNNFDTARAAVQIKGMVYGDKDQVLASKTAYCGNTLTNEQLATMPLTAIESAMANQFGTTLDNLEVAPGKSISCMVVFSNLPADSKNYGAVLAGSSPVTPKKK